MGTIMGPEIIATVIGLFGSFAAWSLRGLWETNQEIGRLKFKETFTLELESFLKQEINESIGGLKESIDLLKETVKESKVVVIENQKELIKTHKAITILHRRLNKIEIEQELHFQAWNAELSSVLTAVTGHPISVNLFKKIEDKDGG